MPKKLSLKDFYEYHGTTLPIASCLPSKPGDAPRNGDQGYNNRLADPNVDSSSTVKTYGSHALAGYGGAPSCPKINGQFGSSYSSSSSDYQWTPHGGSNDTVARDYGDVDYYSPYSTRRSPPSPGMQSHYGQSNSARSAPMPPPPPLVGPAANGSAAAPCALGQAPMGNGYGYHGPASHGGAALLPPYEPGPGHSQPSPRNKPGPFPAASVPRADHWYPTPPPPPPRAVPLHPGLSAVVPARVPSGPAPPAVMASAADGVAAPSSVAVPPPPPRRQVSASQPQVPDAAAELGPARPTDAGLAKRVATAATAITIKGVAAMSLVERPAVDMAPEGMAVEPDKRASFGKQLATAPEQQGSTVQESANKEATGVSPFAAASDAKPASAVPEGPKNEFAERLAQKALASAARAKSSLVAGGSLSSSSSLAANGATGNGTDATVAGNGTFGDSNNPFVKPEHPFGRPRLVLKPRSVPVEDYSTAATSAQNGNGHVSSNSSDSGADYAGERTGSVDIGRPRLQLQPRTILLSNGNTSAAAPAGAAGDGSAESSRPRLSLLPRSSSGAAAAKPAAAVSMARKPSVFGDAKPREEILRQRGQDPILADLSPPRGASNDQRLSEAAVARFGSITAGRGGGSRSSVSGVDDEWHTVPANGKRGSINKSSDGPGPALLLGDDPFFGSSGTYGSYTGATGLKAFDKDIMRDGRHHDSRYNNGYDDKRWHYGSFGRKGSSYGSPSGGWGGRNIGHDDHDGAGFDTGDGVFRRALPTRQLPLAM